MHKQTIGDTYKVMSHADVEEESSGEDGGQAAEDTIVESSFEGELCSLCAAHL